MEGWSHDSTEVITRAAEDFAKEILLEEGDPSVKKICTGVSVFEVRGLGYSPIDSKISQPTMSYAAAYRGTVKQMEELELDDKTLARGKGWTTSVTQGKLKKISSANLIVVCRESNHAVYCSGC